MTQFEQSGRAEPSNRDAPGLVAGFDRGAAGREVFTIRDLTKEFAVSARTLRFYEEKGLLAPRRNGEQRLYGRRDRSRLRYVLMGKRVGFSLEEVREMLDLYDLGDGRRTQLQVALAKFQERSARLEEQRAEIDRAIAELARASLEIQAVLVQASGSSDSTSPGLWPQYRQPTEPK